MVDPNSAESWDEGAADAGKLGLEPFLRGVYHWLTALAEDDHLDLYEGEEAATGDLTNEDLEGFTLLLAGYLYLTLL